MAEKTLSTSPDHAAEMSRIARYAAEQARGLGLDPFYLEKTAKKVENERNFKIAKRRGLV